MLSTYLVSATLVATASALVFPLPNVNTIPTITNLTFPDIVSTNGFLNIDAGLRLSSYVTANNSNASTGPLPFSNRTFDLNGDTNFINFSVVDVKSRYPRRFCTGTFGGARNGTPQYCHSNDQEATGETAMQFQFVPNLPESIFLSLTYTVNDQGSWDSFCSYVKKSNKQESLPKSKIKLRKTGWFEVKIADLAANNANTSLGCTHGDPSISQVYIVGSKCDLAWWGMMPKITSDQRGSYQVTSSIKVNYTQTDGPQEWGGDLAFDGLQKTNTCPLK